MAKKGKKKQDNKAKAAKVEQVGLAKKRGCTDILVLLAFILFVFGWFSLAMSAFKLGDPRKIWYPTNSAGHLCGQGRYKGRNFSLYFDVMKCAAIASPLNGCPTLQVCVEKCPEVNYDAKIATLLGQPDKNIKAVMGPFCVIDVKKTPFTIPELAEAQLCPQYVFKSKPILGRCLPDIDLGVATGEAKGEEGKGVQLQFNVTTKTGKKTTVKGEMQSLDSVRKAVNGALSVLGIRDALFKCMADLFSTWWIILLCLLVAFLLSFLWIFSLRYTSSLIVWATMFFLVVVAGCLTAFCYLRYTKLTQENTGLDFSFSLLVSTDFFGWPRLFWDFTVTWIILGIASSLFLVLTCLLIIFLRSRIAVAIEMLNLASQAVTKIDFVVIWPLGPMIFQLLLITFFVVIALYLVTAVEPVFKIHAEDCPNRTCNGSEEEVPYKDGEECSNFTDFKCSNRYCTATCLFTHYRPKAWVPSMAMYNLFAVLWTTLFVRGFSDLVLAGSFTAWYFTKDKANLPHFVLMRSIVRNLVFHLGTAAFGSLILAVIKFVRIVLEYIDSKLKDKNKENFAVKFGMWICRCALYCLEKCVRYLNRNAYIITAIYGYNFCKSAREAFTLLIKNFVRAAVLTRIAAFVMFVSKMSVVGITVLIAYGIFSTKFDFVHSIVGNLNYFFVPIILVAFASYFIVDLFLQVYEMAVDTIFMCFLEDLEQNDGSKKKPYFMPVSLQKTAAKYNEDGTIKGNAKEKGKKKKKPKAKKK